MPSVLAPIQIDHYRLDTLIAASNTASVYRGTDLRLDRPVAIKIPHMEVEKDPLSCERFRREQEIGERLDHPSVVKLLRDGVRSRVYIVMEWVDGQLLRQILNREGKLSPERSVRILVSICDALEYIHSHGVTHRDIKPENIMVDAGDRIKLIDFGIAGARWLTPGNFSQMMGTPDYISPEQVQGKPGDARSDIYAVGVMFYEMLTGTLPFNGDNPFAVMNSRLWNHPAPPREIDAGISPQLQEIVCRAMERDPRNRYARARELAWDLQHQDQVGISDRSELQEWRHGRNRWTRGPLRYGALALAPIAIFGALLYAARHL